VKLWTKTDIFDLLEKYNLQANKSFGQNFLIDKNILDIIIETGKIEKNDHIIEVGPGLGVLTNELLQKAKKVTSIELDKKLIPVLQENFATSKNFDLINEDALKFTPPHTTYKVIANIPYNITSPLISHFLQNKNKPISLTLLIQKEVAEKIIDKKQSILSLQVKLFAEAKLIKKVSKNCFYPAPKIDSAIIHLKTHNKYSQEEAIKILTLAKKAFSQKRKKLSTTIGSEIKESPIDLNRRPETLSIEEWKSLIV